MFDFLKSGGTPGSGPPDKKELSVEMRLLLAFILMGAVLFTTPYFFKAPPAPPVAAKKAEPAPASAAPQSQAAQPSGSPGNGGGASSSRRCDCRRRRKKPSRSIPTFIASSFRTAAGGPKLGSQEVQGSERQAAGSGEHGGHAGYRISVFARLQEPEAAGRPEQRSLRA